MDRHPEWQKVSAQVVSLYKQITEKALENEAFYSQVLTINVGSEPQKAILKDLQRHPAKDRVMHADFLRVDDKTLVKVNVPIHFLNEEACVGVKLQGGIIQHQATDIEVQCLPGDIPEYIEVDLSDVHMGDIVHLSDLKLPAGVEVFALKQGEEYDSAVATIHARKGGAEPELEGEGEGAEEAAPKEEGGESEG